MPRHAELPESMLPSHYIEKVSLLSGDVLDHEILPEQLLVHQHRDYHVVDFQARRFMSRLMRNVGDEEKVREKMREVRRRGRRTAELLGRALRVDPAKVSETLFGLKDREYFFRYKQHPLTREEIEALLSRQQQEAKEKLNLASGASGHGVRVLLTGGTGFVGKEFLWQTAQDDSIQEVVVVIRPKEVRDRKTKDLLEVLSSAQRGETLLDQLWLDSAEKRGKFRFVAGDVEQADLGIDAAEIEQLKGTITHFVHSAASVSFDDPYEKSFRANVIGTVNALRFSHSLQNAPGSPFVAHVGIETSYIHGRQVRQTAREDSMVFPRNFYNNYYELTKAMASIETENFILKENLRVVQLCPAIVIGESRAGNNRGDTKVVNAPVNVFGRAHQALRTKKGSWVERSKGAALARLACIFPGDPSAQINLIPVDRVVQGMVAALKKPEAVGRRVHLGTDNRITSKDIQTLVEEELGVRIKLADPTTHRNITLPLLTKTLTKLKQPKLARGLQKLGTIFGGYSEWGQPIHEVGRDVTILGLSEARPVSRQAFRMLCRHNRYVQEFGQVWDLDEISRREKVWWGLMLEIEKKHGGPVGALPAETFRAELASSLNLEGFVRLDVATNA